MRGQRVDEGPGAERQYVNRRAIEGDMAGHGQSLQIHSGDGLPLFVGDEGVAPETGSAAGAATALKTAANGSAKTARRDITRLV